MKKLTFLFIFLLLISPFSKVYALDVFAFGSYWNKEEADQTWGAGAGVAIPLLTEFLRLDGRAYFFEESDIDNDDKLELIPLDFGLQVHILPGTPLDPYLLAGASYVYADADRYDVDSEFGAYAGAGLDYALFPGVKLFGEALYRSTELSSDIGKFDEDIDVSGITANAGLKIHF